MPVPLQTLSLPVPLFGPHCLCISLPPFRFSQGLRLQEDKLHEDLCLFGGGITSGGKSPSMYDACTFLYPSQSFSCRNFLFYWVDVDIPGEGNHTKPNRKYYGRALKATNRTLTMMAISLGPLLEMEGAHVEIQRPLRRLTMSASIGRNFLGINSPWGGDTRWW